MQFAGGNEKSKDEKESQQHLEVKGGENHQKEKEESAGKGKLDSSDTYRGKELPAGMKIKKRVSDEERRSSATNVSEEAVDKKKESPTSTIKSAHPETTNQTTQDSLKDSHQKPKDGEPVIKQTEPAVKDTSCESAPSTSSQALRDSDNTRNPTSSSESSQNKTQHKKVDEDDDDVVVSVKPATQKNPVAVVQKTLTAYPGFNPASKVIVQQGAQKGLHSLLTAQLQQKKVS